MPHRCVVTIALVLGLLVAASGCSGSHETTPDPSVVAATGGSAPTTASSSGDSAVPPSSRVVRFDAPADVACRADTASVQVTYVTVDLTAVAFVVDGTPVAGGVASPTSGEYTVTVPCDGDVHTIMLVGSGSSGPAFATKAVATRPT